VNPVVVRDVVIVGVLNYHVDGFDDRFCVLKMRHFETPTNVPDRIPEVSGFYTSLPAV
jgi:hypothetical protein